jgi:hypothetical protein
MNKLYFEENFVYSNRNEASTDDHLYGHAWQAWIDSNQYYLEYISGELAGRLKKIQISFKEFEDLKLGLTTCDAILLIHGAY